MQQNYMNPYKPQCTYPNPGANAVSINIYSPQAFSSPMGDSCANNPNGFYSLYGQNHNQSMPFYPMNYNNLGMPNPYAYNPMMTDPQYRQQYPQQNPQETDNKNTSSNLANDMSMSNNKVMASKTDVPTKEEVQSSQKEQTKKVVPLTDDYIKSLEGYMNNNNPKIRLIGTKELLERFKEDENRKDNPSLMPLLNKALRDTSPSVRFLALTALQLGYALGNNETVEILKTIQSQNKDKTGEDALLASEILLKMAAPEKVDTPMTQGEIEKEQQAQNKAQNKSENNEAGLA